MIEPRWITLAHSRIQDEVTIFIDYIVSIYENPMRPGETLIETVRSTHEVYESPDEVRNMIRRLYPPETTGYSNASK